MLTVDRYSYIRTAHRVYGKKVKQITREKGHSRNTIKKVLSGHPLSLPDFEFSNLETTASKGDKYATVVVHKNRYSVPSSYAYFKVSVVLYIDRIDIFYSSKKIASHHRLYGNNKWSLLPDHYLELISQRPQAFESARVIRQSRPNWPFCLERPLDKFCQKQGHTKGIKDFISALMLYKDHAASHIESPVETPLLSGVGTSDIVKHIFIHKEGDDGPSFRALDNWQSLPPPHVFVYGQIAGGL